MKPRLSRFQIFNMCVGFLGIQVGFGLQNANVSRIFQTLGAKIDDLAILWIAAPVTGLLVQPIIGHMSDRTWGRLGRRRPYFLWGALLAATALFAMPNAHWLVMAAATLWIMDASINVTMEPFRAFVGDLLPDEQRTTGFAMQSVFIGVGAVAASALPWILTNGFGVSNTAPAGVVPPSVQLAFYMGAAALLATVLWTVFTTREYSPTELAAFEAAEPPAAADERGAGRPVRSYFTGGLVWFLVGGGLTIAIAAAKLEKELYIFSVFVAGFGLAQLAAGLLKLRRRTANAFSEVVEDLFQMPVVMKQLAVVQFFSWFGLFAMWIYTTPAVTAFHFGTSDPSSRLYNEGADWVGLLFAAYNGVAALAAFTVPLLAARTSRRISHMINLSLGGLGLIGMTLIRDPHLLWICMIGVGFAWASILSTPYAILSSALPARKMGVYMGIFNFSIVVPQLLAATVLGLLLKTFFAGQAIWALVLGGASLLVAAVCVFAVTDPAERTRLTRLTTARA